MKKTIMIGLVAALAAASLAVADVPQCKKQTVFTESFAGGVKASDGNWWHHFNITRSDGRKNKEYVYSGQITTFWPRSATEMNAVSEFHGNYAARGVTAIEIDLATISSSQLRDYTSMSPTLILVNDSGTPKDIFDDCVVFFQSGETMPLPDVSKPTPNWTHYTFEIPSGSQTLPTPNSGGGCIPTGSPDDTQMPCWGVDTGLLCPVIDDPDLVWQTVINDVDQIKVEWMAPGWFRLIEPWESAIDNASISECQ